MDEGNLYTLCTNVTEVGNIYPECLEVFQHDVGKPKTLFVVLLTFLIISCIIGNCLVCVAFFCYRRLRVITHYYIFSLAVSDLLVGMISMPIWLNYELTGWGNNLNQVTLVNIMDFVDILTCISSVVNLSWISIDRFFGIVKPLQHKTFVTEKCAILFIFSAWLYSFIIAGLKMVPTFMDYFLFCFVTGYAIPVVVICACYLFIFSTVKKHGKRRLGSNQLSKKRTLAKTIAIVVSFFIVCWTPFFVVTLLYQYCVTCSFFEEPWFDNCLSVVKALHYLNSTCNPFIYGVFNKNFRTAYKAILYRCLGLVSKDFNAKLYEMSFAGRHSSVRQRSNTINSVLSYSESMRSQLGSTSSQLGSTPSQLGTTSSAEADDLICANNEKFQRRFKKTGSNNSIVRNQVSKPMAPTGLEDEPRFLLRQKIQKQISLEQQYSPSTAESDKIFDQIAQAFSPATRKDAGKQDDQLHTKSLIGNDGNFMDAIQSKTSFEIGTLLADARESNI